MPGEYSQNAYCVDVLRHGGEYFVVYEKEEIVRDEREYKEVTKYLFFESSQDWVK